MVSGSFYVGVWFKQLLPDFAFCPALYFAIGVSSWVNFPPSCVIFSCDFSKASMKAEMWDFSTEADEEEDSKNQAANRFRGVGSGKSQRQKVNVEMEIRNGFQVSFFKLRNFLATSISGGSRRLIKA